MATIQAQKRLTKEYKNISANPPPYITAAPSEDNILEWHYVITGPPDTVYENGQYHGTLQFHREYPFKPPSIRMVTPSGRFKTNTRLCLSMSDFHPDTWNPAWSVSTILIGLLSFMTGSDQTTGSLESTNEVRRKLAKASREWNNKENPKFRQMFPDLVAENERIIEENRKAENKKEARKKQREIAAQVDTIEDPEEKLRAIALLESKQKKSVKRQSGLASWTLPVVAVLLIAMGAKFLRS